MSKRNSPYRKTTTHLLRIAEKARIDLETSHLRYPRYFGCPLPTYDQLDKIQEETNVIIAKIKKEVNEDWISESDSENSLDILYYKIYIAIKEGDSKQLAKIYEEVKWRIKTLRRELEEFKLVNDAIIEYNN